ncbi:uncharacterized protein LOC127751914 [Frankliniella occidentalis]|uniref:Uncharacterized protein LOC127751914 n=1 Tax=Frankliniella occidentalis TaxID=133901 RepID=A0A9C6XV86_FRAOC|nr:uncharacterized protein LOC127751914 [Frankliniella occidentalis]
MQKADDTLSYTFLPAYSAPVSGVLRNKVESPAQAKLKPREEQGVSCVVLLAPDDQRGQAADSPGPASSVCFSLEEDDEDKKRRGEAEAGTVPRRGILGRPLSKTPNGAQGKDEAAKGGIADDKGVKTGEQVNKKTVQDGRHGERKDEKVGPGFSGSSLMTLHRSAPADYSSSKINTLVVPGLVRPSSSVCFSLEEYEKEQADEEQEALQRRRGLVQAKANKPARPPGQYRPHALHGPYGPHRPYGAKRSTSAARLAWWRRSPPPSAQPPGKTLPKLSLALSAVRWKARLACLTTRICPGRSIRPEAPGPAAGTGAVDEEGLRGCLRCVEYRASPRAAHRAAAGPRLPVRLRIGSSRQSRLGVQLRAYDGGQPHRHRSPHRRALQDDAEDSASRPASRVGSSVSPRVQSRASVYVGAVKSNIHLAKIYAKTDLVTAAARHSARPPPARGAPHRPLQHLPTCPRYDGPDPGDAKQLLTLFESRAAGQANRRAAAQTARDHRDYLAHLSEYVRAISKGPRPATVIRNQLRVVRDASPGAAKQQPSPRTSRGAATHRDRYYRPPEHAGREQLRWREPLAILDVQESEPPSPPHSAARHKREPTHSTHRKHTCRDSRSQRPRGRRRAMSPSSPAASPVDFRTEPFETPETAPGADHGDATPQNNTICSFICEYCRKLRQML